LFISSYFFQNLFKIEEGLRPELQAIAPWLAVAVPMATVSGVMAGSLQGRERFLALNIISASSAVSLQILPLAIAWKIGPNLALLVPATIATRVLTMGILFILCQQHVIDGRAPRFDASEASHLLRFGGWVTITSLVSPLMHAFDRFLIGILLGAKAVTYYMVPFQVAEQFGMIPQALTGALFPRLSMANPAEERRAAELAIRTVAAVLTPLFIWALLLIQPFLQIWIGRDFSEASSGVARIVLISFWANCLARIPFTRLQARGRPDLVAKAHLAELVPYAGLLFLGMRSFGLEGAAIAFGIRVVADLVLLEFLAGSLMVSARLFAVPSVLLAIAFLIGSKLIAFGLAWFISGSLLSIAALIWSWSTAPQHIRLLVQSGFKWQSASLRVS
jgi:O-antigen/teichoic acid export membrane protein